MFSGCSKSSKIYAPCPYTSQTIMGEVFFETGGYESNENFRQNYALFTPISVECVTVGISSGASSNGFDELFLRAGALDGTTIPLSNEFTVIFVAADGYKTSEMIDVYNYSGKYEDMIAVVQEAMKGQPKDVDIVRKKLISEFGSEFVQK